MCAIPLRPRLRCSSSLKVSRVPTVSNTLRASSATRPVSSPRSSRRNCPPCGSRVFLSMCAISSAFELYQLVWPPRWWTATGWSETTSSSWRRVRTTSNLVSSNMNAVTHWSGGTVGGLPDERVLQLAERAHVAVDAEQLVDAARMGVRVDEAGRHRLCRRHRSRSSAR